MFDVCHRPSSTQNEWFLEGERSEKTKTSSFFACHKNEKAVIINVVTRRTTNNRDKAVGIKKDNEMPTTKDDEDTAARVDRAASKAFELIQEYADVEDPHSDSDDNPWKNPKEMFKSLDKARSELNQAWADHQEFLAPNSDQDNKKTSDGETAVRNSEEFRAMYMDMITDAFADVLEDMRESTEVIDVDILVDCLQSGIELLSVEDREGFFQDLEKDFENDMEDTNSGPSYHEIRRREMGLDVEVSG